MKLLIGTLFAAALVWFSWQTWVVQSSYVPAEEALGDVMELSMNLAASPGEGGLTREAVQAKIVEMRLDALRGRDLLVEDGISRRVVIFFGCCHAVEFEVGKNPEITKRSRGPIL